MITYLFIIVLVAFVNAFFSIFPVVTIDSLPYIGQEISDVLVLMVGYWNSFQETLPYVTVVWKAFLWVILPFELLLLIGKIILGSRNPTHTNN